MRRASTLCMRLLIVARRRPACQQADPAANLAAWAPIVTEGPPAFDPALDPVRRRCFSIKHCWFFPRRILPARRITGLVATRDCHDRPLVVPWPGRGRNLQFEVDASRSARADPIHAMGLARWNP